MSRPQADHPLLVRPLLFEIWASIFCYVLKKYGATLICSKMQILTQMFQ